MGKVNPTEIISHWNHMFPGFDQSSDDFYTSIMDMIGSEGLREIKTERIILSEGGIFSNKREYLQVRRDSHVFHICAAPYGKRFFISWWLGEVDSGLWSWIARIPGIGGLAVRFFKPQTYFKADTAGIFQSLVHGAVMETIDGWSEAKGISRLVPEERKPMMRDFFSQLKL